MGGGRRINGDGRPGLVIDQSDGLYGRQQHTSLSGHFLDAVLIFR